MTLELKRYPTLPDLASAPGSVNSPLLYSREALSPSQKKKKNLHPSDLMLPITSNTPRGLSVNIAPPKERGPQTNRL